jgi:regulator of protease activity HflC (stomatin/prohibitin superfamily)
MANAFDDTSAERTVKFGAGIIGFIIVVVILFFIFCFRTVDAGQVGIVTRFGEVNRVQTSGIAIKAPWPFEKMIKMEIRVQKEEQTSAAATSDLQDVNAKIALNYALDTTSALKVYKELGTEYKDRVVTPAVQESFKAASAKYTAQELITKRTEVKEEVLKTLKARLEKYGIRVVDVNITDFQFSTAFNQAIEAVQIANQNVARARQELETTKVQAEKDIAAAQGQAEAQRLQQQTLTPELVRLREIEAQNRAIDKWNGVLPTTQAGENSLFNIPVK